MNNVTLGTRRNHIAYFICKSSLFILVSIVTIVGAGWLSWDLGVTDSKAVVVEERLDLLARVEAVKDAGQVTEGKTSALVQQALVFAYYLDPPKTNPPVIENKVKKPTPVKKSRVAIPKVITHKFKLLATSVHGNDPNQSMALIEELGTRVRWVRKGEYVGHQIVKSISKGRLVMQDSYGKKVDEVVICRERQSTYRVAKKKEMPEQFRGWEGIARLRFEKKE